MAFTLGVAAGFFMIHAIATTRRRLTRVETALPAASALLAAMLLMG
ncbi:hypothetical protein AB0M45_28605 [Nocardia sp. NPDC051787]